MPPGKERQCAGRRGGAVYLRLRAAISRTQRVFSEERKDIGQHQFLMLLLVVDPRLDHRQGFFRQGRAMSRRKFSST